MKPGAISRYCSTSRIDSALRPHDARKLCGRENLTLAQLLEWAGREFTAQDLFLLEAGANSFEIHGRYLAGPSCE